jgi:transglutaminase-like putative cysteine protease
MTSTQGRFALAGAIATLLASLTLAPLLQGVGWFVAAFVVVAVVVGVGAAARQVVRWWPVVALIQVAALALCLTWLFARESAVLGLVPGLDAVHSLNDLLQAGLTVTRRETPPVPAVRGVILVACGGIGLVALAVDVIAASLRRPAVAGLPLLAVYCVPAAVLPGGLSWWYFVLGASGFLVLVGSDSVDRVRGWGRVLGPAGDDGGERAIGGPLAGARRLAVGCVLLAALVPALVPGLGERLIGNTGSGQGGGKGSITVVNPILRLRNDLTARSDSVVLRYTTTARDPEPLRIVSDDVFDGAQWAPSLGKQSQVSRENKVQNGLPSPPGLSPDVKVSPLRTSITTTAELQQTYLPLPYPPTKIEVAGPWLYDSGNLNVVGDGVDTRNLRYTVDHVAVDPTPEQLQRAGAIPREILERYTKLPDNLPGEIEATARRIGRTGSAYEQALNVQEWLRKTGGFTYSTTVDPPRGKDASSQDAVVAFLRNKRGYCVQFASAMAVMARTLDIPSRVAVGFLPGTPRADNTYEISLNDAHAWPELYFGGIGWVRFEPTPASRVSDPPPWAQETAPTAPSPTATVTETAGPASPSAAPRDVQDPEDRGAAAELPLRDRILGAIPWRWLAVLLVLVLLGAVPMVVELLVRRARWRRAGQSGPAVRAEAAWDELREQLEDLGVTWAASWTPRALQLRLISDHALPGSAQAALGRLVADLEHARYAPPDDVGRGVPELRDDVAVVVHAVSQSGKIEPWTRRRARWLPTSGLRVVSGALRRVDVAADEAGRKVSALGADVRRRVGRH